MDNEEKTTEEVKKENATETKDDGDKPKKSSLIDDANLTAERLEAANAERKALLNREEELIAKRRLGGIAEAGIEAEKPKEETPKEYKDKVMRGEI